MELESKELRVQTICLVILSIIGVAASLFWLRPVMIPFVLAVVAHFIITPFIDIQRKYLKFPYFLAVLTSLILGFFIVLLLWLMINTSITQLANNSAMYQTRVESLLANMTDYLNLDRFGLNAQEMIRPTLKKFSQNTGNVALGAINTIFGLFSKTVVVLIFLMFLLLGRRENLPTSRLWGDIQTRIKRYLVTKFITSILTGFLVGITLMLFGIDLAIFFGVAAFILNFIPSIGSIIAVLLPLPVVLFNPEISLTIAILAITIPGMIEFTIGNIIEPKMMGDSLDLHPIVILMALIFWGMIWGIVGMLLAAPLTAIMKIIFERIEVTQPLAHLFAGRLDKLN